MVAAKFIPRVLNSNQKEHGVEIYGALKQQLQTNINL